MGQRVQPRAAGESLVRCLSFLMIFFFALPSFAAEETHQIIIGQQNGYFIHRADESLRGADQSLSVDESKEDLIDFGPLKLFLPPSVSGEDVSTRSMKLTRVRIPSPHHVVTLNGDIWVLKENGQAWQVAILGKNSEFEFVADRPGYVLILVRNLSRAVETLYLVTPSNVRAISGSNFNLPSRPPSQPVWELKNFILDHDGNLRYQGRAGDPWDGQVIRASSMSEQKLAMIWDPRVGSMYLTEARERGIVSEKSTEPRSLAAPPPPAKIEKSPVAEKPEATAQSATPKAPRVNPFKAGSDKIAKLDEKIREDVYGQDHLTRKFAEHFSNLRQGVPTVLVVTGPSGVGKSHLARVAGVAAFQDPGLVLEIEGTDFQSPIKDGSVAHHRLFGAEKAYQGQQTGAITEWMRKTGGNGVLIINEAEKMHPDYWKRLMPLFEKGQVTAGSGETFVSYKMAIVLTSNRGAHEMFPPTVASWSPSEIEKRLANLDQAAIKRSYMTKGGPNDKFELPREIINRITEWLAAGPLTAEAVLRIAGRRVRTYNKELKAHFGVEFELDPEVVRHLALTGFKASDDGRQVQNQVQASLKKIEDLIGQKWSELNADKIQVTFGKDVKGRPLFKVSDGVQRFDVAAPTTEKPHPLHDPVEVARLQKIPEILNKRVIGQDSAVKSIAEAVMAVRTDTARKRPVSIFLIGTTGTGKTEFGRGLSLALYDSADRVNVLSLGDITSNAAWAQKFGYAGMESMPEFEELLVKNPEGGVIVFDEASNMGGSNQAMKEEFFKKLYEATEEGVWTSPVTGKKYELHKFIFLFTGNDGETLFRGITADDMRLQVWKENMSRARVRQLLIEAGVPEAFLNRMADTILMRPLTRSEIHGVVVKLLTDRIKSFESQHRGLKITYDNKLLGQIADSLFTNDRGARGIRSILDDRLPNLLAQTLINSKLDLTEMNDIEIRLSLSDNAPVKPYLSPFTPERKVVFAFELFEKARLLVRQNLDVTQFASKKVLREKSAARWTAIHEAGHAVVPGTGMRLRYVTIIGGYANKKKYLGYASYDVIPGQEGSFTRSDAVKEIASLYAGQLAVIMEGGELEAGWADDLKKIRSLASKAVIDWGLEPELFALRLNSAEEPMLTPRQVELARRKIEALMEEGRAYAQSVIEAKRPLLRSVAAELLRKGSINGTRFTEMSSKYNEFSRAGGQCRMLFGR